MKKILSFILCALMVLTIVPVSVFMVSAEDEVTTLYENDFSDPAKGADSVGHNATTSIANGVLTFANWGNNTWTKNVTLNNATGLITISFTMQPNLAENYDLLSVNGVVVLSAGNGKIVIDGTDYSASVGGNTPNIVRNVTVTVDPATGIATVKYAHPHGAQYGEVHEGTVNVGTIGDKIAVTLGGTSAKKGWTADNLKVTQAVPEVTNYTITYTGEGVTESTDETTGIVTLLEAPVRDGYTFMGWNDGTTTHAAGATITVSADTTFTAVWEEVTTPDEPAGDDVLYENDFSSADKVAEGTAVGNSATYSDGKLGFAGWNGNSHWSKTVELNKTDGAITVSATIYPNWNNAGNPALTVNGKTVVWNAGSYKVKLGDDTDSYNSATNAAVYVTVTVDPKTGDAVVVYDQTAADLAKRETTVNVGTIGATLDVKFGYAVNGWSADDLKITQVKGNKLDVTTREDYKYYKNDFSTITGTLLNQSGAVNSSVVEGALKVEPTETNQWNVGGSAYPSDSVVSFKAMVPELLEEGTDVVLLYNRATLNYLVKVTAGAGTNVVTMDTGTSLATVEVEAGEWFTVTVVMTSSGSTVFCNNKLIGTSGYKFAGRDANYGLFNFNHNATANTVTYYVDDIEISTVADEKFVKVTGYQKTVVDGGKYNVRFIASIVDLYEGQENIGFEVEAAAFGKSWNDTTTTVYNSITANFGTESVEASKLGGKYVTAYAITGVPADEGTVEFVVRPYVTINGVKVYGSAVTVSVNPVNE